MDEFFQAPHSDAGKQAASESAGHRYYHADERPEQILVIHRGASLKGRGIAIDARVPATPENLYTAVFCGVYTPAAEAAVNPMAALGRGHGRNSQSMMAARDSARRDMQMIAQAV